MDVGGISASSDVVGLLGGFVPVESGDVDRLSLVERRSGNPVGHDEIS